MRELQPVTNLMNSDENQAMNGRVMGKRSRFATISFQLSEIPRPLFAARFRGRFTASPFNKEATNRKTHQLNEKILVINNNFLLTKTLIYAI